MSDIWAEKHKSNYAGSDWVDKPSIFAEMAITYIPRSGRLLDLGAGQGQDSRFFAEHGYEVVSTDYDQKVLDMNKVKLPESLASNITLQPVDLREKLPFEDASFEVVYAHLALHYFDAKTTKQLIDEIYRVLKPGGALAFIANSTSDPEYGTGEQIEPDYFHTNGMSKRYFSVRSAGDFTSAFSADLLDNNGDTYKDMAKGVHNLIRFIGAKPE